MNANVAAIVVYFSACSCAAPTLQQRQDNWFRYRDMTRATCTVGQADPAMPEDVRAWCVRAVGP